MLAKKFFTLSNTKGQERNGIKFTIIKTATCSSNGHYRRNKHMTAYINKPKHITFNIIIHSSLTKEYT